MKISRREFLGKGAAAAGMATVAASAGSVSALEKFAGYPDALGLLIDTTRCIGCRSCEAACNKINELPAPGVPFDDGSVFEEKRRTDSTAHTVVNRYEDQDSENAPVFRKIQCMHCKEPACASACFVGAFKKTPEGAVVYNADVCIGCRYCMVACPFGIPAYEYDNVYTPEVTKCTLCYERIKEGLSTACAEACPTGAVQFGRREDLLKVARQRIQAHPERYVDHIYGEHEAGGTGCLYLAGVEFDELGLSSEIQEKPYGELTRGFLSAVPLVLVLWPALLGGFYILTKRGKDTDTPSGDKGATNV